MLRGAQAAGRSLVAARLWRGESYGSSLERFWPLVVRRGMAAAAEDEDEDDIFDDDLFDAGGRDEDVPSFTPAAPKVPHKGKAKNSPAPGAGAAEGRPQQRRRREPIRRRVPEEHKIPREVAVPSNVSPRTLSNLFGVRCVDILKELIRLGISVRTSDFPLDEEVRHQLRLTHNEYH
jgi:hypothetical protein